MGLFKRKKKDEQKLITFRKIIEYRGYSIEIYGNQELSEGFDKTSHLFFDIGWRVCGIGQYHSNVSDLDIPASVSEHIETAKLYIDNLIILPDKMKKIQGIIDNIEG